MLIEDILKEVKTTEDNNITNIIIQYTDLEGETFFEKMEDFKYWLDVLETEHNLYLLESKTVAKKHWLWSLPIYFDSKYKFIQFNLEKRVPPPKKFSVECGSIWQRPVDGTVIEVQGIEGRQVYVKVLEGTGLMTDTLNFSVLEVFWNKK